MVRFPIPALTMLLACVTFDVTRPVSNAPHLVALLRGPRDCYTPCGVRVAEGDCEAAQRYEGRVLKRLARAVPEWSEAKVCADLNGFELRVHWHDDLVDKGCSSRGWRLPDCDGGQCSPFAGICVAGLTVATDRTITLSQDDWEHSAFAHEVAHVADAMRPGHCPWKSEDLRAALYELAGYVDPSSPERECSP